VAGAAQRLGLRYVVITSVTRDDLQDGGAAHFATTIEAIHKKVPKAMVEVLVPDFQGSKTALHTVLAAHPHVLNHNLETVPRLYTSVRPEAVYEQSLELLMRARQYDPLLPTKSGLMLGLGESSEEVEETLRDLLDAGCLVLTLGQYLQPTRHHLNVDRFIDPAEFDRWREKALRMGFRQVASGPLVRSSYRAKELYQALQKQAIGNDHVRPSPL
jgi:lipoic acid synthetase